MKRRALAFLLVVFFMGVSSTGYADSRPEKIVQKLTDDVLAILQNAELSSDAKREQVKSVVVGYVDFEVMSRLVLARRWKTVSVEKQREFVEEFKSHLAATYERSVDSYRDEVVTIIGDREEPRGDWTVKTEVVRNGPNDLLVDYRLRKRDSDWKIIDVIIEQVSLVSNFRSQLRQVLSTDGIDGALRVLRKKNPSDHVPMGQS